MSKDLLSRIGPWILMAAVVMALVYGNQFLDLFRLDGGDTLFDYHASSMEEKVEWRMNMCDSGRCLDHVDWACGFEIESSEGRDQVDHCFTWTAMRAQAWTRLDQVRKYCGKRYATHTGNYGSQEECKEAGGNWGEKTSPPPIWF